MGQQSPASSSVSPALQAGKRQDQSDGTKRSQAPQLVVGQTSVGQSATLQREDADTTKLEREALDLAAQQEMAYWAEWMFWSSGAGAIASVFAAWLLYRTLRATRISSEIQLRAYVAATVTALSRFSPDEKVEIVFEVKNHGQTPASNVRCFAKIQVWPFPLPDDFDMGKIEDPIKGTFSLAPTAGRHVACASGSPIDRATVNEILNEGTVRVYLAGKVLYEDMFGKKRETRFCVSTGPNTELRQVSEGEIVQSGIIFNDVDRWNEAD